MSPSPVPLIAKEWHSLHLSMGQEENTAAYTPLQGKSTEDPPEFPSLAENKLTLWSQRKDDYTLPEI